MHGTGATHAQPGRELAPPPGIAGIARGMTLFKLRRAKQATAAGPLITNKKEAQTHGKDEKSHLEEEISGQFAVVFLESTVHLREL